MRILVYGLNYSPELTGIGKYTGEMCTWLASRGHDVRVVTTPPYYPAWRIGSDFRNRYTVQRESEQLSVYRCPLYVPDKPTGLKRVVHLFSFMLSSLPILAKQMFWQPEIVFTVEPTFFCAPIALLVAKATGAASWLHVQDFEVDAAFELGLLPSQGTLHDVALMMEESITRRFDRVSSISGKMVERAESKGVPQSRVVLFPNWVDVDQIYPQSGVWNSYREELGLQGKIVLLYSGNMGAKQGLELLAPLAQAFGKGGTREDLRVHFVFCGDGAYRAKLEESIVGCANVTLLPLQPYDRLNELLNAADIHLLPQRPGAADLVMPSKLTGMLSSGKPVIATTQQDTQMGEVIRGESLHQPCGLIVPPGDKAALYDAAALLIQDSRLRHTMGTNARQFAVNHLGREEVLLRFEQALTEQC